MRVFINLFVIFIALAATFNPASAMTVAPAFLDLTLNPGTSKTFEISVQNDGNIPIEYATLIGDLVFGDEGVMNALPPSASKNTVASWLTIKPVFLTVPGGSSGSFQGVVSMPRKAKGSYYAMIYIESLGKPAAGTGARVRERVGVPILISSEEGAERKLEMSSIQIIPSKKNEPVRAELVVRNLGNIHIRPRADVFILRGSEKKTSFKIEPSITYPGRKRTLKGAVATSLPPGEYDVVVNVDYGAQSSIVAREKLRVK